MALRGHLRVEAIVMMMQDSTMGEHSLSLLLTSYSVEDPLWFY